MSLIEELPVFKTSYELMCVVSGFCVNMEIVCRFTLGVQLQKVTADLLLNICRSDNEMDRSHYVMAARENILVLRMLFRMAYDKKQLTMKEWVGVNDHIESVNKQLIAWEETVR